MNGVFETKAALDVSAEGEISGIAWPFGTPDRAGDMITKGAFAKAELPLPMLAGHDRNSVIGVWTHLEETVEGLIVKGHFVEDGNPEARKWSALAKTGAIKGLSVAFGIKAATARKPFGRTITDLDLVEISLVSVPSHPGARIRSLKNAATALALADAINRLTLSLPE